MNIGIVGAGNIGSALARALSGHGHQVRIANSREPATLVDLVEETGAEAVYVGQAAEDADIVVVTLPLGRVPELPDDLLAGATPDLVVVDTNNYNPARDGQIAEIEDGVLESRWVELRLGHAVVKAFNCIPAAEIVSTAKPKDATGRLAMPVAGDDHGAKAKVMELVEEIGFNAVDVGGIDESWRMQPGSPPWARRLDADELRAALATASPERPAEWRA